MCWTGVCCGEQEWSRHHLEESRWSRNCTRHIHESSHLGQDCVLVSPHSDLPWPPGLHPYSATTHNFWPSPSLVQCLDVSHAVPGPPALFQVVARPLLLPTAHTHPAHSTPPFSSSTAATLPSALERANLGARIF